MAAGLFTLLSVTSCKHDPPPAVTKPGIDPASTQYPIEVAKIMINKCATAGCHNEASYKAAGSLRLDDWKYLFEGSSNGAVAIPYSPENSSLLYFLNPAANKYDFISVAPTMPYNEDPLSKEEYDIIKNWIINGAPDKNGSIPFGSNPNTRQKAYMTQQGCDLLGVVDAEKKVIMRYIKVGANPNNIESPHFVMVDNAGAYAYICVVNGSVIQKIDTKTDQVVGTCDLSKAYNEGKGINVIHVSDDGTQLIASQLIGDGRIMLINTSTMTLAATIASVDNPHGIASNPTFDTFYITGQYGNTVYKVVQNAGVQKISMDGKPAVTLSSDGTPDPHEIMMTPDYSKYFLTCEKTNEVRVMDRLGDSLLKVIPVGKKPQEMALCKSRSYLFVSCMEDVSQVSSLFKGSVYVIDYNTLNIVKRIDGEFYQPHGMAVDEQNGILYIASRNSNANGPAPHHTSDCGGRNGYYQVYDINTLAPANGRRYEVTPDPYSISMRFK
ncbi:MAG: hypothetical protein H6550_00715 [Chitinophagales bacterium]|nr:hypothetical protein [Chitinophagales bacterium]